tara:strand:+ start:458 stop:1609 length:1152 start_codon:yes stop_codon:yes gene_type:complete
MEKIFTSLGLMSGTSMDGIDVSVINSDGKTDFNVILNKYFEYPNKLRLDLAILRDKISTVEDLKEYSSDIKFLEKEITLFHGKVVNEIIINKIYTIDLIGFHGQTIYHNSKERISKQLGDAHLLSQITKKKVIYNFRENDLKNGGQGAPLAPIFHNVMVNKYFSKEDKKKFKINILNIGGIANVTKISDICFKKNGENYIEAKDIGPGNCLIDEWVRKKTNYYFDKDGLYAYTGKTDNFILTQALENFEYSNFENTSLDIKNFDISFVRGLSIENGASTLTDLTGELISRYIISENNLPSIWIVCGGGRKNKYLMQSIKKKVNKTNNEIIINPSEKYNINGDFVESQAFAYIAIRSFLKLPISFPRTTFCKVPLTGGSIISNF